MSKNDGDSSSPMTVAAAKLRARRVASGRRWVLASILLIMATGLLATSADAQTFPITQTVRDTDPGDTVLTGNVFTYRINYRCNSTT